MSRPQLSNSRIKLIESIGPNDHVKASCWLNIEDTALLAQLEAYIKNAGEKGRPNVQLELVLGPEGNRTWRTVGSFNLFVNEPRPAAGGLDGFNR
tara:strand:- start:125 stop:409 length:285 start_codon:yes stop_codon:yes gene_type:complete